MAPRRWASNKKVFARIVVTPLVDVVLVLLVLFLVLTPLLARSLDVREPHETLTVAEGDQALGEQLVVQAHPNGLWMNGTPVAPEALSETLRERLASRGATVVFFQGHPDLKYADAVRYLDLIRASGAEILGVAPELEVAPATLTGTDSGASTPAPPPTIEEKP